MPDLDPNTIETLGKLRLIPVISLPSVELADPLADALVAAGLPCAEVTFRTSAAEEAIRVLSGRGDLFVAAGTVLTIEQAQRAVDAGAQCLLSPGIDPAVVEWCNNKGVQMIPGVATPSDILLAQRLGLSTLKFFPAQTLGGPAAINAISGPFPEIRFIPTGGITSANLADYLALPNVLACGGSWMVSRSLLEARDFSTIEDLVQQALQST